MDRIFVIVTPICQHYPGRKVGSKECTQCDHFRGGIVQNFVDCAPEIEQKTPKSARKAAEIAQPAKKRGRPAKKAISKPIKTRKKKNG